jgi:sulfopyruvate decarboxylase subunit beta
VPVGEQGWIDSHRRGESVTAPARATPFVAKDALNVLHAARDPRDIVITTMSPARDWMTLSPQSPLDVVFVPSAMGHATSLGLGLALAQPDRRVVVCNGDASMLMNLGSLVTIVGADATNVVVLVFQNGVYEVTGSQPMPATADFATIARGAGFSSVFEFSDAGAWASRIGDVLSAPGPVFAVLHVAPDVGIPGPKSPGPAGERARRLRSALLGS